MTKEARYYAAVLTMAEHTTRADLRAAALGRLAEALGDGAPAPGRGVYLHDGSKIVHATEEAAALLGTRAHLLAGYSALAIAAPDAQAGMRARVAAFRRGESFVPSLRTMVVRVDGRAVPAQVSLRPIVWEGRNVVQVSFVDLTEYARLS
jgi:PAS domain S-box-containing protein